MAADNVAAAGRTMAAVGVEAVPADEQRVVVLKVYIPVLDYTSVLAQVPVQEVEQRKLADQVKDNWVLVDVGVAAAVVVAVAAAASAARSPAEPAEHPVVANACTDRPKHQQQHDRWDQERSLLGWG